MEITAYEEDIKMYLEKIMTSKKVSDELKDQITCTICSQAQGMYVSFFILTI